MILMAAADCKEHASRRCTNFANSRIASSFPFPPGTDHFTCFVVAVYAGVFGVALILTEIRAPMCCTQYMGFTMTFLGRGLAYIFLGCLIYLGSGFCYFAFIVSVMISHSTFLR